MGSRLISMFNKIYQSFTESVSFKTLSISALVYFLVFFACCCLKYHSFAYNDFDLAIHDQIIWNMLHGRIFNSILGIDFLGNHVHFISFLVAPFYSIFPHPLFLLFLQTLFLAAGVFPLYALARVYLGYRISLIIGLVYLLYPGLGYTNLYEFHPTCFATFFILCAAFYFYTERFFLFSVFMLLSLICQENIALIFILWGFYAFLIRRKWNWVLWPMGLGLAYFLLCVYVILPDFNKNTLNFFSIYGPMGGSLAKVLHTCFVHPLKTIGYMFMPNKISYLFQVFAGVGLVPFLSPLVLLPDSLLFIQHLLSSRPSELSLHFHYTAELIPFIFIAFIFGVKKLISWGVGPKYLGGILLVNALIVNFIIGPRFYLPEQWEPLVSDQTLAQRETLIKEIPPDAPVIVTFSFLSHMSHRQYLYSFHHVYTGFFTLSNKPFHLPDNVKLALIDFNDYRTFYVFYNPAYYRNIYNFLKQGLWGSVEVHDKIVLFKKGVKDKYPLFNIIDTKLVPPHPVDEIINNHINLYGYDARMQEDYLHLVLYFKLLQHEDKDINLYIDFIDKKGFRIVRQYLPLCYRIWPTEAWQKNQLIEAHQYISISPKMKAHLKNLMIGFYDFKTGKFVTTDSKDDMGRVEVDITN